MLFNLKLFHFFWFFEICDHFHFFLYFIQKMSFMLYVDFSFLFLIKLLVLTWDFGGPFRPPTNRLNLLLPVLNLGNFVGKSLRVDHLHSYRFAVKIVSQIFLIRSFVFFLSSFLRNFRQHWLFFFLSGNVDLLSFLAFQTQSLEQLIHLNLFII